MHYMTSTEMDKPQRPNAQQRKLQITKTTLCIVCIYKMHKMVKIKFRITVPS